MIGSRNSSSDKQTRYQPSCFYNFLLAFNSFFLSHKQCPPNYISYTPLPICNKPKCHANSFAAISPAMTTDNPPPQAHLLLLHVCETAMRNQSQGQPHDPNSKLRHPENLFRPQRQPDIHPRPRKQRCSRYSDEELWVDRDRR